MPSQQGSSSPGLCSRRKRALGDTIVHLSVDVILGELITDIEAAAHAAGVMLAADVLAFFVLLVVINFLLSGNGHVAIIQLDGSLAR